nr:co-chaperone GroES [candidate division Zixibacteria bacterium]
MRPLENRIIVSHVEEEGRSGGIFIFDTAMEKSVKGNVIALEKDK